MNTELRYVWIALAAVNLLAAACFLATLRLRIALGRSRSHVAADATPDLANVRGKTRRNVYWAFAV